MKRGGQVIYAGPLGRQSHKLVEYFEVNFHFSSDASYHTDNTNSKIEAVLGSSYFDKKSSFTLIYAGYSRGS